VIFRACCPLIQSSLPIPNLKVTLGHNRQKWQQFELAELGRELHPLESSAFTAHCYDNHHGSLSLRSSFRMPDSEYVTITLPDFSRGDSTQTRADINISVLPPAIEGSADNPNPL